MTTHMVDFPVTQGRQDIAERDSRQAAAELVAEGPSLSTLFEAHFRVIGALLLRDIRTRVGGTRFGFLISLAMPLGHIGIMLTIYYLVGRRAPIGTSTTIFLATGALAFVIWLYGFRQIKMAPQQNRHLTHLPGVTLIDLLIARSIVELISTTLVVLFTLSALKLIGLDVMIFNPPMFAFALFQCYLLGVSFGFLFAVLGRVWHVALLFGNLLAPAFWITSGVLFIPAMLPGELEKWVWFVPLAQLVDLTRVAYYGYYISDFYSGSYVAGCMLALMSSAAIFMYVMRTALSEE